MNCKKVIPAQDIDYFEAHFTLNEGTVFPLEERFQNLLQENTILQVSQTVGFNDSVQRFNSIGPFTYAACPIIFPLFVATAQGRFVSHDTYQSGIVHSLTMPDP